MIHVGQMAQAFSIGCRLTAYARRTPLSSVKPSRVASRKKYLVQNFD
jgi:hypothetical protein